MTAFRNLKELLFIYGMTTSDQFEKKKQCKLQSKMKKTSFTSCLAVDLREKDQF